MEDLLRSVVRAVLGEAAIVKVPTWARKFTWNVDRHAEIDAATRETEQLAEELRAVLPTGEYTLSQINVSNWGARRWQPGNASWWLIVERFAQTNMFDEGWLEANALANIVPTLPLMTRHAKARIKKAVVAALKESRLGRLDIKVDVKLQLEGRELIAVYEREQGMWGMTTNAPSSAPPSDDPIAKIPEMVSGLESPKQKKNGTRVYHHVPTDTVYGTFANLEDPSQLRYVRQLYDSGHELTKRPRGSQNAVLARDVTPQAAAERIAKRIANIVKRG